MAPINVDQIQEASGHWNTCSASNVMRWACNQTSGAERRHRHRGRRYVADAREPMIYRLRLTSLV